MFAASMTISEAHRMLIVANGEGENALPSAAVETCLTHPAVVNGQRESLQLIADLEWIDV
jgi:hypothetical protein